ncbi:MAG: hypothetical protein U0792_05290 [Gemmataceae bacterium]
MRRAEDPLVLADLAAEFIEVFLAGVLFGEQSRLPQFRFRPPEVVGLLFVLGLAEMLSLVG